MSESTKTASFCAAAFVLVMAAILIDPGMRTPEVFSDQGQLFYPGFKDPQAPKTIEVVDYDEATATSRPRTSSGASRPARRTSRRSYSTTGSSTWWATSAS